MLLASSSSPLAAQEITAVNAGDPAPFQGMLFSQEKAVDWRFQIELLEAKLELNKAACAATAEVRGKANLKIQETQRETIEHNQHVLEAAAVDASEREWFEHPVFSALLFAAGVVVGSFTVGIAASGAK